MSVSKPFIFALVCELIGPSEARARLGANATGRPFNSIAAIEEAPGGLTNPMVNAGAIATTSLVPGATGRREVEGFIHDGLSRFAGRTLHPERGGLRLRCSKPTSATAPSRACCRASAGFTAIRREAIDLYTRQCSLNVSARDLAVMGATLADGGVNPITGERVVDPRVCHYALAVMATAGFYETSGDWLYEVGLPGKSGIGGGIVTVSPGKGGHRHVRTAVGRRRQQRERPARRPISLAASRHGSARLRAAGVTAGIKVSRFLELCRGGGRGTGFHRSFADLPGLPFP